MKQIFTCFALVFAITAQAQHYQTASTGIITDDKLKPNSFYLSYGEGIEFKRWQVELDGIITFASGSVSLKTGFDFGKFEVNVGGIDIMELLPHYRVKHTFAPVCEAKIKVLKHVGIGVNYANRSCLIGVYFK